MPNSVTVTDDLEEQNFDFTPLYMLQQSSTIFKIYSMRIAKVD